MTKTKDTLVRLRIVVMYIIALALVLLVPLSFMLQGTGLIQKIGRKIPIREGTFNSRNGDLSQQKPAR